MALMNSDLMMGQLLFPIVAAAFRNAKGNRAHLSATDTTRMRVGPWEKGNDRAIFNGQIAVVEMIRIRIIKVDGLFD